MKLKLLSNQFNTLVPTHGIYNRALFEYGHQHCLSACAERFIYEE